MINVILMRRENARVTRFFNDPHSMLIRQQDLQISKPIDTTIRVCDYECHFSVKFRMNRLTFDL